jgi:phosphoglycolate phosphatase
MAPASPTADVTQPYQLVLFDFDGTLSDSGHWFLSIVDELAERFGLRRIAADEVEALRGKTTREVIRHVGVPRWRLPAIARYTQARFAESVDQIQLFDGIREMIAELAEAGTRMALVTSNSEANARAVLGEATAARLWHIEGGASLFGKAPKFRRVLKRARIKPAQAISIGDETRDITAARKLGVAAGAVTWGYANREVLTGMGPDILFDTPADITRLLLG